MASLTDHEIERIAQQIVADLGDAPAAGGAQPMAAASEPGLGIFGTVEDAVRASADTFPAYVALPMQTRNRIIASIRETMMEHASALAKAAYDETGLGRFGDKIVRRLPGIMGSP